MKAVCALLMIVFLAHHMDGQSVQIANHTEDYNDVTGLTTTDYSVPNMTEASTTPAWRQALDILQLIMTSLGFVANVLTIILLVKAGQRFTPSFKILLQHQAFVDGLICLLAIPLLTQPFNWKTGNKQYDEFMCHIWHSQVFFWTAIYVSVWNLVLIAIERYIAVKHPLKHIQITKCNLLFAIGIVYITAVIVLVTGFLQVKFEEDSCSFQYYFTTKTHKDYMSFYSIYWFFVAYAVPFLLLVTLYGIVIFSLRKRKDDIAIDQTQNRIIDKVSVQFTRTAILVSAFFMVSLSFDSFYYILGTVGVTTYVHGSRLQRVALFLTVMNSVANPFIYVMSMPAFRLSIKQLFCGNKNEGKSENQISSNSISQSSVPMPQQSDIDVKF